MKYESGRESFIYNDGKLYVLNSVFSTDFNRLHLTFPILTFSSCQALILFSGEVLLITSSMAL